jgi:hypothetical protein
MIIPARIMQMIPNRDIISGKESPSNIPINIENIILA